MDVSSSDYSPSASATVDVASKIWHAYNAPDSALPFVVPLVFWTATWLYYRWLTKRDFAKFYAIHTLHHVVAILLGSISLYVDDNSIFHERIGILFSMPYFIVDILDCLSMGHFLYILHGAICLGLGLCNYHIPLLMQLRMNSKAVYIESSSILLYQVKQKRNATLFAAFALNYTLCRIVWIPIMGKQLWDHGLEWHHPIMLALMAFYGLQINWWIKILHIVIHGDGKKSNKNETNGEAKKKE